MKVTLTPADNERGAAMAFGSDELMEVVPAPDSLARIDIAFEDGSTCTVIDRDGNLDSTVCLCGGLGEDGMDTRIVLNRLVDPAAVTRIRINDLVFTPAD